MKVHKIGKHPEGSIYIGRPSKWKNPYKIGKDGNRSEVIAKFEKYATLKFENDPNWLEPLIGKDLYCYCAPEACHGDIIIKLLT